MRSLVEREECLTRDQRSWEIWRFAELAGNHDARDQACFEARRFRAAMAFGLPIPKRSRLIYSPARSGIGGIEISVARLSCGSKTISRNAFRYVILSRLLESG